MLSPASRPIIDASVPLLQAHGETITRTFYSMLFADHPALKHVFNSGNQANGAQQQSLASAVYAYAANIDNPAALGPVVSRIAHKHAAVGVTPAQYTVVGKYLLAAIARVLGELATPPVLAAWDEAYWLLAVELIAIEARLYHDAHIQAGQFLTAEVVARTEEGPTTTSFLLRGADGRALPDFQPGQYITVIQQVHLPGESQPIRQLRQYSLSNAPGQGVWRISVKRERGDGQSPNGVVSNQLCDTVQVGDNLQVSPPFGDFVLKPGPEPLVLVSGGIGIAPVMSMLLASRLQQPERPVVFLHACRDGADQALRGDVTAARADRGVCALLHFETPRAEDRPGQDFDRVGQLALESLPEAFVPTGGQYYLCGPLPFMQTQRRSLLSRGVDATHIHFEVFRPNLVGSLG